MGKRKVLIWVLVILLLAGGAYAIYKQKGVKADTVSTASNDLVGLTKNIKEIPFDEPSALNDAQGTHKFFDSDGKIVATCSTNCPVSVARGSVGHDGSYLQLNKTNYLDFGPINPFSVRKPGLTNPVISDSMSIGFWLKLDQNADKNNGPFTILGNANGNVSKAGVFVNVTSDNHLGISISDGTRWYGAVSSTPWREVLRAPVGKESQWNYYALTFGRSQNTGKKILALTINGGIVLTTNNGSIPDSFVANSNPSNFVIGRNGSSLAGFDGQIDNITIRSGYVFTLNDIYTIMRSAADYKVSDINDSIIMSTSSGLLRSGKIIKSQFHVSAPAAGTCVKDLGSAYGVSNACSITVKSTDWFRIKLSSLDTVPVSYTFKVDKNSFMLNGSSSTASLARYWYDDGTSKTENDYITDLFVKPGTTLDLDLDTTPKLNGDFADQINATMSLTSSADNLTFPTNIVNRLVLPIGD